jgi:hypothetical protein
MVSPRKTAPDAPPISATARDSARFAGPIRPAVAVVRPMWAMRKRLFSHSREPAAARTAVKGAPFLGAFIGAKRRPWMATAAKATRSASRARDDRSVGQTRWDTARRQGTPKLPEKTYQFPLEMEYLCSSGAKRRAPRLRRREPRHSLTRSRPLVFNKLTP